MSADEFSIDGAHRGNLKLSRDRKVSPLSKWEAGKKRWVPQVANAFGLPAGQAASCPGETPFCSGCYAAPMEGYFPAVGRLVSGNLAVLRDASVAGMVADLSAAVSSFVAETAKVARRTGRDVPLVFRIHWDGDLFSFDYARAWARVARAFPSVSFWLYTRSFDFVAPFSGVGNVAVYLSVDAWNVDAARSVKSAHPWVRLAFCGDTWDETEVLAQKFEGERRGPRCPELTGRLDLVGADGVGACVTCGLCIYGRNNVRFAKEH